MPSDFQSKHQIIGLAPVADAFSGTVYSDVVSMSRAAECRFTVVKGVGTTGTSTITVQACDNFTPSNRSAVAFHYRKATSGDALGAWTAATTAGFTTTAGSNQIYEILVRATALPAGYPNVQLKAVEVADDPVLGGIMIELGGLTYQGESPATAIA